MGLLFAALTVFAAGTAHAVDGRAPIQRYKHTSWSVDDGAPVGIQALAQSSDGFLWIGAPGGVYRFDGVSFEHMPKPTPLEARADSATALLPMSNGDVWVGYYWGGVALYHNGKPVDVNYLSPTGSADQIAQDSTGGVWIVCNGRKSEVHRFSNGKWISDSDNWGLGHGILYGPVIAKDGAVVVAAQGFMFVLRQGESRFQRTVYPIGFRDVGFARSQDGQVWTVDQHGLARTPLTSNGFQYPQTNGDLSSGGSTGRRSLLFDHHDDLWGDTAEGGVFRISRPESRENGIAVNENAQWFSSADGLTSNAVNAMIEDREGNIWIATQTGLDRLSRANVTFERRTSSKSSRSLILRSDNNIFFVANNTLLALDVDEHIKTIGHIDQSVGMAICSHKGGGGWISDANLMHQFSSEGIVKTLEGPFQKWTSISNCVEDARGNLWVGVIKEGTYFYDGKSWTHFVPSNQSPSNWPWLLTTDDSGRVLMYFGRKEIVRVEAGHSETVLDARDTRFGLINAIYSAKDSLLVGDDFGLIGIEGKRVAVLDSQTYPFLSQVSGIVQTSRGETWVSTAAGLVRIASADLTAALAQPGLKLPFRIFDYHDGLPGSPSGGQLLNLLEGPDGRIWFLSALGSAWVDPANLAHNVVPPPVLIRSVAIDGIIASADRPIKLPQGTRRLQIDYTALSFVTPDRVSFRYRLEGFDKDWIDPGLRRQAFYTNLPPGAYRFHVIAANDDGVWNKIGASIDLNLPPTFLQSNLFVVLCVVLSAFSLWLAYSFRMRQVANRIRGHLQERLTERERIARELHDTLLQGVQGLILRLQSIADQIPAEQPAHGLMESALDRAEDVLVDGRDRVRDLRVNEGSVDLVRALTATAAGRATTNDGTEFRIVVVGKIRPLHPIVHEEATRISCEAILNAFQHARAHMIIGRIGYHQNGLKIQIADDGIGIPAEIAAGGQRDGHYGMSGMRERAARVKGILSVRGSSDAGSSIDLDIPASVAYQARAKGKRKYQHLTLYTER